MRAINKVDIELGQIDLPISIYSAIEKETGFKQFSKCCESSVKYVKQCSACGSELNTEDIFKGLLVGDKIKKVDTDNIKTDNGNLTILGVLDVDIEQNVFYNGDVWFVGFQQDKKNKRKTERNLMKFSYFRESLRESSKAFIGLISLRGKEKIVILKPYFNGLVGLGVYHFDRIRDIKEIAGYSSSFDVDKDIVKQMSEKINEKDKVLLKNIENEREKRIELAIDNTEFKTEKKELENPLELVSF